MAGEDAVVRQRALDPHRYVVEVFLNDEWLTYAKCDVRENTFAALYLNQREHDALERLAKLWLGPAVPFFVGPVLAVFELDAERMMRVLNTYGAQEFCRRYDVLVNGNGIEFERQFRTWYAERGY